MKKILLASLLALLTIAGFSQAKKPTLMVIPSDAWFIDNNYYNEIETSFGTKKVPNYTAALQEDLELLNVISRINGLMAERGFPLKNLESVLKDLEQEQMENAALMSKSGAAVDESALDMILNQAKADIIIQLTYQIKETGPRKHIIVNLQGLDSYTNKQIASAQGIGAPSLAAETAVLLDEAILANMDNFTGTLQVYFDDLFENGREIAIEVLTFDSWGHDLESEIGGEEVGYTIEDWLAANTVKGRFSTSTATATKMEFEQVRIPLYSDRGRALDARGFARELSKFLRNDPYQITNKVVAKGLGEVQIILGEK